MTTEKQNIKMEIVYLEKLQVYLTEYDWKKGLIRKVKQILYMAVWF